MDNPGLAVRKPEGRSRISNGSHLLPGTDGRSTWARRLRDLIALHTADLGGVEAISAAEASIIRRAACLTVELERLELVFATTEAKPEDLDLYQRMSNTLRRHLETHRPQARAERRDADPVRILGFKGTCVKPTISIREALTDPSLLGNVLTGQSWQPWRVLFVAAMGEPLTDEERATFTALTGRPTEPLQRVEEFCAVVGRRGGKSRAMAILAAYVGGLCEHDLVRGETGIVLLIVPDQRQAKIALDYCAAALEQSPILKQLIANRSSDALELTNGISIEVRSASFRRLRGPTYVAVIADEAAFWYSDEFSANADDEISTQCVLA